MQEKTPVLSLCEQLKNIHLPVSSGRLGSWKFFTRVSRSKVKIAVMKVGHKLAMHCPRDASATAHQFTRTERVCVFVHVSQKIDC